MKTQDNDDEFPVIRAAANETLERMGPRLCPGSPMKTACRMLTSLPFIGSGALAVTQALEGWSTATVTGSCMFVFVLASLLLSDVPWEKLDRSIAGRIAKYVLFAPPYAAVVAVHIMLSRHLAPTAIAIWAVLVSLGFIVLLFWPSWLARYTATLVSLSVAAFAFISTCVFLAHSYQTEGSVMAGLAKLPSPEAQIAAVVFAGVAPVGLVAPWPILLGEGPWRRTCQSENT